MLQLELARKATQSHRDSECFIDAKLAKEYADKSSEEMNSEVFPLTDRNDTPTNKFGKDRRALWLFQDQAENYGKFLFDNKINEMPLWFFSEEDISNQRQPFLNQLWLHSLHGWSGLGDNNGNLFYGRVRGVSSIGEVSAQKISEEKSELYTLEEIKSLLHKKRLSGLEDIILPGLRELREKD